MGAAALLASPAKLATTAPVIEPTATFCVTPVSVAIPLLFVMAEPTDVPCKAKVTVSLASGRLVVVEVRVANKVALPPKLADPETAERAVVA